MVSILLFTGFYTSQVVQDFLHQPYHRQYELGCSTQTCSLDLPRPCRMPVTKEGLYGFPTKNVIILVVTVTGWGIDQTYSYVPKLHGNRHGFSKYIPRKWPTWTMPWNPKLGRLLFSSDGKLVVWIFGIPLWKGLLLSISITPRIPNHKPRPPMNH